MIVSIKGLEKGDVLLALWKRSKCQGLSYYDLPWGHSPLCHFEIKKRQELGIPLYFDYYAGKIIKCDITWDEFDSTLYDRDNGEGAAQMAIDQLRLELTYNKKYIKW